jgi:ferric-dicitrate binding protein FerR (iron transport regulator)
MNQQSGPNGTDETAIAQLLRAAGKRPVPDAQSTADVRAAVEAEWRTTVADRRGSRAWTGWAMAAGVAAAAVAVWIARPLLQQEPTVVASLERSIGDVQQNRGDGRWVPLAAGGVLESGTTLRTAAGSGAALRLKSGLDLRLDARTELALDDADRATLGRGAVYVDSGPAGGQQSVDFVLGTPEGTVQHLGTQYQARLVDHSLSVGVREGRVRVATSHGDVVGDAGERLAVTSTGISRSALPSTDPSWSWIAGLTPPFSIEGRSVEDFLIWAARETGRTVVYTSPAAARQARSVVLSGTVEGLTPDEAVRAVLTTTSLRPDIGAEHIRVGSAAR